MSDKVKKWNIKYIDSDFGGGIYKLSIYLCNPELFMVL